MISNVFWHLSDYCKQECSYCPPRYRNNSEDRKVEDYLGVIEKIQASKYTEFDTIRWSLNGGEPFDLEYIDQILKAIKSKPSIVKIATSGGNSWFDYMSLQEYIDQIDVTFHHWQNISVIEYIIDFCQTNDKKIRVKVPYFPGKVREQLAIISEFQQRGIDASGHLLHKDARGGNDPIDGYSQSEFNLINGLPEDWTPPPAPPKDPDAIDPNYVDMTTALEGPQSLGSTCYAGVDFMYISHRGFVNGSDCGGRTFGNVFEEGWTPVTESFKCPMFYCRSDKDKRLIRINR